MADNERLTKRELQERRRAERKAAEAAAAKRAQQQTWRRAGFTLLVLALIGGVLYLAFGMGPDAIDAEIVVAREDAIAAQEAAGCEVTSEEALPSREHFEPQNAPAPDSLYTAGRPTNSGGHYSNPLPPVPAADRQLDERATTHNLEHGSVIAWYDPAKVDGETVSAMESWAEKLSSSGFAQARSGGGIFVSPYSDPGISSGKAIAVRSWGFSMDCDSWDETYANGIVIERYGSHGPSPEANLSPFPEGVLAYADGGAATTTETEGGTATETETGAGTGAEETATE